MSTHDAELLEAAELLLERPEGDRLSHWRVRRSISTIYYAIFHFLLDEIGQNALGTHGDLAARRQILARTVSHKSLKTALGKVRGKTADKSVAEFLKPVGPAVGPAATPAFIQNIANVFVDAQKKREEADYDLNQMLSEEGARELAESVKKVIAATPITTSSMPYVC